MRKSGAIAAQESAMSPELRTKILKLEETNLRLQDQYLQTSAARQVSLGQQLAGVLFENYQLEDRIFLAQQQNSALRAQLKQDLYYTPAQNQAQDEQLKALRKKRSAIAKQIAQVDERVFQLQSSIKALRSRLEFEADIPYAYITSAFVGRAEKLADLQKAVDRAAEGYPRAYDQMFRLCDECSKSRAQSPEETQLRYQISATQQEISAKRTKTARMQSRIEALKTQKYQLGTSLLQAYFAGKWLHAAICYMKQLLAAECRQPDKASSAVETQKMLFQGLPEPMRSLILKVARLRFALPGVQALLGRCCDVKMQQFYLLEPGDEAAALFEQKMHRAIEYCKENLRLADGLVDKALFQLRASLMNGPQSAAEPCDACDCYNKPDAGDESQELCSIPCARRKAFFAARNALKPTAAATHTSGSGIAGAEAGSLEFTALPLESAM